MTISEALQAFQITIRFYEELNDFIKNYPLKKDITVTFYGKRSVKDLIESFGVPHVEVDLILINHVSVGFDYILKTGDRISVYPMFERYNINHLSNVRSHLSRDSKFVLDVHLGKLAFYLRLLGFDTDYQNHRDDEALAQVSNQEQRILLTRDRKLLMRSIVSRGLIIRHSDPYLQLLEILNRIDLWDDLRPFTRCTACNGLIIKVDHKSDDFARLYSALPDKVKNYCKEISTCPSCKRLYWKGSHYEKLQAFIENLLKENTLG